MTTNHVPHDLTDEICVFWWHCSVSCTTLICYHNELNFVIFGVTGLVGGGSGTGVCKNLIK